MHLFEVLKQICVRSLRAQINSHKKCLNEKYLFIMASDPIFRLFSFFKKIIKIFLKKIRFCENGTRDSLQNIDEIGIRARTRLLFYFITYCSFNFQDKCCQ